MGLEPTTARLSVECSDLLSYTPNEATVALARMTSGPVSVTDVAQRKQRDLNPQGLSYPSRFQDGVLIQPDYFHKRI